MYFLLIFIQLLFIKTKKHEFQLTLTFESEDKNQINKNNYFEINILNEPKILLKIGTHHQLIPCYLNINTYTLYISGSNSSLDKSQIKYNSSKSKKYHNLSNMYEYDSTYTYGIQSMDEICLDEKIINIKFYLAESKFAKEKLRYSCLLGLGYEGLMYNFEDEIIHERQMKIESFITQLKKNNIIKKKIFFIIYNKDNDNGKIIFGEYPHETNYCNGCDEGYYNEIENIFVGDLDIIWSVKGFIFSGEKQIYEYLCSIDFELNQGFIIGNDNYKNIIEKNFFNKKILIKECFKKEVRFQNKIYECFYCKKNVDINNFENLILYINKIKYEIVFNYKDIFEEKDEYLFFNIVFPNNEYKYNNGFVLGKPFFKKYPIVFNVEGIVEKIGFYHNLFIKENPNPNPNISTKKINKNRSDFHKISNFILILIGIFIIVLLSYIIRNNLKKSEKRKVNQLIEFYDYSVEQKENN